MRTIGEKREVGRTEAHTRGTEQAEIYGQEAVDAAARLRERAGKSGGPAAPVVDEFNGVGDTP